MFFKPRIVTGIDIGSSSVKIVQLEKDGDRIKIVNAGLFPLPREEEEETTGGESSSPVAEAIRHIISEKNMKLGTVITAIPRHLAALKYVRLPSQDPEEIRGMILFEAGKYIPFPREEAELGYLITEMGPEGDSEILLVAVQKKNLQEHLAALAQARIEPAIIDLSSLAISNCYHYGEGKLDQDVTALIHIGARMTEINITSDGCLRFSRSIRVAGNNLITVIQEKLGVTRERAEELVTEQGLRPPPEEGNSVAGKLYEAAEDWVTQLASELRLSLDASRAEQRGRAVKRILLSGGLARMENLSTALGDSLGLPVEEAHPLEGLEVGEQGTVMGEMAGRFPVAIGLALRETVPGLTQMDLTPEEVKGHRAKKQARSLQVGACLLLGTVLFVLTGLGLSGLGRRWRKLSQLESKIQELKPEATYVSEIKTNLAILKHYAPSDASCLEVLRVLSESVSRSGGPEENDISLTNFTFEKYRRVEVSGQAVSKQAVYALARQLAKAPHFQEAIPHITGETRKTGKDYVIFTINCKMEEEKY